MTIRQPSRSSEEKTLTPLLTRKLSQCTPCPASNKTHPPLTLPSLPLSAQNNLSHTLCRAVFNLYVFFYNSVLLQDTHNEIIIGNQTLSLPTFFQSLFQCSRLPPFFVEVFLLCIFMLLKCDSLSPPHTWLRKMLLRNTCVLRKRGRNVVMEVAVETVIVDVLSPPFLCWLSREECPPHSALIAGAGGFLPGWVRTVALSASVAAAVVGAGYIIYCYQWRRRDNSQQQQEREDEERRPSRPNGSTVRQCDICTTLVNIVIATSLRRA